MQVTKSTLLRASSLDHGTCTSHMSSVMRKPVFCICKNKDADQLSGNHAADQRLCFRYLDCTVPLLPKFEISSLLLASVAVQPGLCRTGLKPRRQVLPQRGSYEPRSEKTGFRGFRPGQTQTRLYSHTRWLEA